MSDSIDTTWQPQFIKLLVAQTPTDAAHDLEHVRRVVTNARRLCLVCRADWSVVMPAAWLHDCVKDELN